MSYYYYFESVHKAPLKDIFMFKEYPNLDFMEFGYTWLNRLFPSFYLMIVILSIFICYVYYNSILTYVNPSLVWFSLFIYLFEPGLFLIQTSAIRQTIAICLFIYSLKYLIERNFIKYVLIIIFASTFHRSAVVLIPIYFIVTPRSWTNFVLIALIVIYLSVAYYGNTFLPSISNIALFYFPDYKDYMNDIHGNSLNSGLGFLFQSIVFLFIIWSQNKGEIHNTVISKLSIIGFIISPMGMYMNMFGRIVMFFSPFIVLSLPFSISLLKSWQSRIIAISILLLFYIHNFYIFFNSPVWIEKYSKYNTILFPN